MSELGALQRAMGAAIASADAAAEAAPLFRGSPQAALMRLAVYRGNMVGACTQALGGAYPIVARIVGAPFFEGLAREYLRRFPSQSGDLNEFGANFPQFVADFEPTQDLPYLPDVARMEWLAHRAYYAHDAAAPDLAPLAAVAEEDYGALRFELAPACALLESRWPLARLWEVHQDDYRGEFAVDLDAGAQRVLIHRPLFRVQVAELEPGSHRFLERVAAGATLATALEAAIAEQPSFDPRAALATWFGAGVIALAKQTENP
ncbi:MAG: hypothetical protein ABT20_14345 [Rubrivivax sp. SCN 70-15]|nr:MAG: hypothetical protein ABT20_14345 [Rubrivivax sp. SCN 70-15]